MTEKQKKAVRTINLMHQSNSAIVTDDEYFNLLELIMRNDEPQVWYHPYVQTDPQPLDPVYGKFGKVTCDNANKIEDCKYNPNDCLMGGENQ